MKGTTLLGFGVSLAVLGAWLLPVFAQSQRYPTDAEVQQQMRQFQKLIPIIGDGRTPSETASRESFVKAWSQVEPAVAPFMGEWSEKSQVMSIFPSSVKGRVCIITLDLGETNSASFEFGSISKGQIRTSSTLAVIVKRGDYIGVAFPGWTFVFGSPRIVRTPTNSSLLRNPKTSRIIQQFKAAGCTASLPQNSENATRRSPSTGQQNTTRRSPSTGQQTATAPTRLVRQTFRDVKSLGLTQVLRGNRKVISAYEKLKLAAKKEYDKPNIPNSDFLTKPFTSVGTSKCGFLGCERKPVSYTDYLQEKLKLKAQEKVLNSGSSIIQELDQYNSKLKNDNRYGGRDISQRIVSNFQDYWRRVEEQTKKPSLSLESIARALPYALEESRVSTLGFIESTFKTGGKLASAFTDLGEFVQILNLPELTNPELFKKRGRSLEYIVTVKEKLGEVKDAVSEGKYEEINNITLEVASETIKLMDLQDSTLSRSADAIKIRSAAQKLIERHDFLQQPQVAEVLDNFDKTYLLTAQVASTVELVTSTLSFIAPGKQAVTKFADKADAVNALLFNALEFTYKDDVRRQYERLRVYTKRNQELISGLSSSIDFSAQEVGQYLMRSRTDVVNRRSDGTIAVSVDGVLYPP
ncbi:hypothetical protein [Iningainema tapete]|uniref:Uncharacterized protein n=1 Tax=Iningainema tapete BLCC-T55 TaxID=2748662 RepID=A0A8J6XN78_9CYAN|nr:hypothetical protein [Iningainema tapete]MBD2776322.1 hypothetical protein [Iningainema tapete BLCC-T55]